MWFKHRGYLCQSVKLRSVVPSTANFIKLYHSPLTPDDESLLSVDAPGVVGPGLTSDAESLRGWSHVTTAAQPSLPSLATARDSQSTARAQHNVSFSNLISL